MSGLPAEYRITVEALDADGNVTARYGSRGMAFDADAEEIGRMVLNTILLHEGGTPPLPDSGDLLKETI